MSNKRVLPIQSERYWKGLMISKSNNYLTLVSSQALQLIKYNILGLINMIL